KVPPDSHRVPVPSGAALPRLRVPPATVVAPLTVALLPRARVPLPPSRFNGPVMAPVNVVALLTVRPAPRVVAIAPLRVKLLPLKVTGPLMARAAPRLSPVALARSVPPLRVTVPPRAL